MSKIIFILASFLLLFPCFVSADAEYNLYKEILGHKITSGEQSLAVDRDGCLWVASGGLVFRYNGTDWEDFTEQSGGADLVSASPHGVLWFASKGHFSKYDGVNWTFYSKDVNFPEDYLKSISASSDSILYFNFQTYIAKYNGHDLITYKTGLLQDYISRLTATSDNGVWLVYHNFFDEWDCFRDSCPVGISYFDGESFHHFTADNGLPKSQWGDTDVEWIIQYPENGDIYISCNGSLLRYNSKEWSTVAQFPSGGILAKGYDGKFWCGCFGILIGNKLIYLQGSNWVNYDVSELKNILYKEIDYPYSSSMVVTPDGIVWMSLNQAILKINPASLPLNNPSEVQSGKPVKFSDKIYCYPNPFNYSTTISFELDISGLTEVNLYSVSGQHIETFHSGNLGAGTHKVVWNGKDKSWNTVSSGVYIISVKSGEKRFFGSAAFVK